MAGAPASSPGSSEEVNKDVFFGEEIEEERRRNEGRGREFSCWLILDLGCEENGAKE